jgi:hypothetical protein
MIFRGPGDKGILDPYYLECDQNLALCKKLANLKIEDCFGQNGLLTRVELRQNCGINISVLGYANLGKAVNHFVNRLSANRLNDGTTISLRDSLNIKKPGPKIRSIMVKRRKKPFDLEKQQTSKTFFQITGIPYVGNKIFSSITAIWTVPGFTNRQKTFIFKYFNNILGINTRTSHFAANATRVCFFCTKKNPPEANDETFLHLFHTCSTPRTWQQQFVARCFPEMGNLDALEEKKLWMLGIFQDSFSYFICSAILHFSFAFGKANLKKGHHPFTHCIRILLIYSVQLANTTLQYVYPDLKLIMNCAGTSSAAAEDSIMSKSGKNDRRHSAPLPVTTAATAQHARSTPNAVISGVLQQAIAPRQSTAPRQEGEDKMEVSGNGTAATHNTEGGSGTAGPETAWSSSRASRETGHGSATPIEKAEYRNYHLEGDGSAAESAGSGSLTTARYKNIQTQRLLRGEHTAIGSGPSADSFKCGDIFINDDNRNSQATLVEDNRALLVTTNSFSLEDWCCVSCGKNHPLLPRASEQRIWGGGRQLIFLTDHNMPAILPSKDGKCPIIIRVDGGLLREIGTNFLLRLSGFAVPEGSVVVIGSVTHLMEEGRVGYTKALVTSVADPGCLSRTPDPGS